VAFEHGNWAIKFRNVQTKVICSNFFVGSVRENLENKNAYLSASAVTRNYLAF
jgi:hypothetical protein